MKNHEKKREKNEFTPDLYIQRGRIPNIAGTEVHSALRLEEARKKVLFLVARPTLSPPTRANLPHSFGIFELLQKKYFFISGQPPPLKNITFYAGSLGDI